MAKAGDRKASILRENPLARQRVPYEYRFVKYQKEVTMRDIAQAAGLAVSTVSKALRNDPSIPEKRCKDVRRLARRLGYRPNPLVAALMAQLHPHRRRDDPHTIAWIDFWTNEPAGFQTFNIGPALQGARKQAAALGYGIEVYRPVADGISPEGLGRILRARGHWGIIVPPVPDNFRVLPLDIRNLAAVTIGTSLKKPVMHRVSPDHFQGGTLAFQMLRAKGFPRVGLILSTSMNERVSGKWLGAFQAGSAVLPEKERVAPLILQQESSSAVAAWAKRERPDAVLLADSRIGKEWLRLGRGGAPSIGWLIRSGDESELPGLNHHPRHLGKLAVDLVVAQIHRNERGSPQAVHTAMVDATWEESSAITAIQLKT